MARRNGDIFTDMVEGAFWISSAMVSHIGPLGCLFLFLYMLPLICLSLTVFFLYEDNLFLALVFLIITIIVFVLYIKEHRLSKAEEKKKEEIRLRYDEIYPVYRSFVSGWGFPHMMDGELWKPGYIGVGIAGPIDKQKKQWIHWHAHQLAMFQATSEVEGNYKSDEPPEYWLARNNDEWMVYRTISLIEPYAALNKHLVPSADDLQESKLYPYLQRLSDSVIEEVQDRRTIKMAKQHAKDELEAGKIIPVYGEGI